MAATTQDGEKEGGKEPSGNGAGSTPGVVVINVGGGDNKDGGAIIPRPAQAASKNVRKEGQAEAPKSGSASNRLQSSEPILEAGEKVMRKQVLSVRKEREDHA